MDTILDNILKLLSEKGKSQKELCLYLNISKQAITNWKNGNNKSYMKRLKEISDFLEVSLTELYGIDDLLPPLVQDENLIFSDEEKELVKSYRLLTKEQQNKLRSIILSMMLED